MSPAEQDRRRALKRERRQLDRGIQYTAARGKGLQFVHLPSTRAKQARWHHDLVADITRRRAEYEATTRRMREIAAELARTDRDEPCMCHFAGDEADASECPAHGR